MVGKVQGAHLRSAICSAVGWASDTTVNSMSSGFRLSASWYSHPPAPH